MTRSDLDLIVSDIIGDFKEGVMSPQDASWAPLHRAVCALRLHASERRTALSAEHGAKLYAAIRTAQPHIVHGPDAASLLLMVCSLHVLVGHWRGERPLDRDKVNESVMLVRVLENRLEYGALLATLKSKRAGSQDRTLVELAYMLYPRLLNSIH